MFKYSLFSFRFSATHERCSVCDLRYEIEPGFFWGAMYISYAFSVAIVAAVIIGTTVLMTEPSYWNYIIHVVIALLLFSPVSFRYARVLMLHLFSGVKYDPEIEKKEGEVAVK
ncbi:MAG: DUF983 domain-containing protein [Bacteroidota bacterium]